MTKFDTVVTLTQDFKMRFGPLGLLMIPAAKMMLGKGMKLALAGLKHHVETGQVLGRDHLGLPVTAVAWRTGRHADQEAFDGYYAVEESAVPARNLKNPPRSHTYPIDYNLPTLNTRRSLS